jgi:hypothetical protein
VPTPSTPLMHSLILVFIISCIHLFWFLIISFIHLF